VQVKSFLISLPKQTNVKNKLQDAISGLVDKLLSKGIVKTKSAEQKPTNFVSINSLLE
jgi:hypothetical protein